MKTQLPTIFVLFFIITINAQQKVVDSLQQLVNSSTKEDSLKVKALLNLSYAIINMDNNEALNYANEALKISNTLNWQKGKALSYRQKGLVVYYKSDYINALQLFQNALEQSEPLNNALLEASIYNNIGNIYSDIGDYTKALTNYNKLLSIAKQQHSINDEFIALTNIATVHVELKKYNEALEQFKKCLVLVEENNLETKIPTICNNISRTYQYLSNNEKAIEYLNIGINKARELNSQYILSVLLRNLANIHFENNDLKTAETLLLESITAAKESKTIEWESQSLQLLYQVYEKQKLPEKALNTYKEYITLRDSIINEEKKSELIKRDLTFENEKKQALAQAEIERHKLIKNNSIIGGGIIFTLGVFGLFLYKRKRDAVSQKLEAEFNTKVANTELKALRAQMNPHFIFNSLNSVNDYISKNDINAASTYLTKFAKIMRQILENSNQSEISLEDDLKVLELYLQVESMRLKNKFTYKIKVDEAIDVENTLVPPLILQPFIENSIWHGISQRESKGHIDIIINKEDNILMCIVDDNGTGRTLNAETYPEEKKSLGYSITKSRIDIINKKKNTNGEVNIIDKEQGVRVEVKLPLQLAF